jgi:hypothetical protein
LLDSPKNSTKSSTKHYFQAQNTHFTVAALTLTPKTPILLVKKSKKQPKKAKNDSATDPAPQVFQRFSME